ncbi:hypothetical protein TSAR_011620, partial [Trichomalopsis sarcophagae]
VGLDIGGVSGTTLGYISDFLHNQLNSLKTEDMKFQRSQECADRKNCEIDVLNFEDRTALRIIVIRKRLECVAELLSHLANINIVDKKGNSALHLAVTRSTPMISLRHLVDKDTNEGQKILYILHAVGAKRCSFDMKGCSIGCKHNEIFYGVAPPTAVSRTVFDQMLYVSRMEKVATKKRKHTKGVQLLCQCAAETCIEPFRLDFWYFHWILTLGIAAGKNLKECQALYFSINDNAFVGRRLYDSEPLKNALKETLGEVTVMADI